MESNKEEKITSVSEENIYKLNGRVPPVSYTHLGSDQTDVSGDGL